MKQTDCTIYEALPVVQERESRRKKLICIVIVAVVGVLLLIFWGSKLPKLAELSLKKGFGLFGGADTERESTLESESGILSGETDFPESESESFGGTVTTNFEESTEETEESTEIKREEYSYADLSESERGDGFLLNYTNRIFDTAGLLEYGFQGAQYNYSQAPVVLILHSYTDQVYADADLQNIPSDTVFRGVVGVGQTLAESLNGQGIPTVHCTVIHNGNGANETETYAHTEDTIKTMLDIYPSVRYVIDLRRLELSDDRGTAVATCSDTQAAQLRMTVSTQGKMPNETLTLALCLRRELNKDGKKLAMPVAVTESPAHASLAPYCFRLDVGSGANTSREANRAAEAFAAALAKLLKK